MGLADFIYDYQTIIAGGLAIGAAYMAAKPVWRQVALTQTQATGVLREMLLQRQTEVQQARSAVTENVGQPLNNLGMTIGYDWDGEPEKINEHEAHHHDMGLSRAISWLRLDYHWRDSVHVDAAKNVLIEKIDAVLRILSDVHAPAHTDQVGEDYAMTDEEWEAFNARGEAAKDEVPGAFGNAQSAYRQFLDALDSESAAIKVRLTKVNQALVSGG